MVGRRPALYFETGVKGENHLFRVDLAAKRALQLTTGARAVQRCDVNAKTIAAGLPRQRFEASRRSVRRGPDGSQREAAHASSTRRCGKSSALPVERVPYKSADGWDVDGFLVKPVGWQAGKKYPMILSIHGGPAGQYGVDWFHEFQVYAAHGWAVFFTNPRGSTGYGQKFERGIEWNGAARITPTS